HLLVEGVDVALHVVHLSVEADVILEDVGDVDDGDVRAGRTTRRSRRRLRREGLSCRTGWTYCWASAHRRQAGRRLSGSRGDHEAQREGTGHEGGAHQGKSHAKHSLLVAGHPDRGAVAEARRMPVAGFFLGPAGGQRSRIVPASYGLVKVIRE